MSLKEESKDFVYRFLFTSVIAMLIFLEIFKSYDPELIVKENIYYLLMISFSFNVLVVVYHKIHFYIFPAILFVVLLLYLLIDNEKLSEFYESTSFILLLIGFGSFVLFLVSDISVVIGLLFSVGLLAYMLVFLFSDMEIYPATPALCIFYICSIVVRFSRDGFRKKAIERVRSYQTFLMPFILVIPLIVFVIPKPEDPISWEWAKNLYNNTVDWFNKVLHNISLNFSSDDDKDSFEIRFENGNTMTYSNESDGDTEVFEITPFDRLFSDIYINGRSFNKFENGNWHDTLETDADYATIDAFETYYGMINYDKDLINDLTRKSFIKIRFLNFNSDLLFAPAKLLTPEQEKFNDKLIFSGEQILFDNKKTYGNEYELGFLQLNYGSRALTDYLKADISDNPEALESVKNIYLRALYPDMTMEKLKAYRDYVKRYYTSEVKIRDSVIKWINDVTDGAETGYEKLKCIETALVSMEYSLTNGALPDYVKSEGDFVDYFIIEKRSGYCVHYATALCLIARYLGYPSRIVQGYRSDTKVNVTSPVKNSSGHSWPEVYFEGKGWIAFEPTPGFRKGRYRGWMESSEKYKVPTDFSFEYNEEQTQTVASISDTEYTEEHEGQSVSWILILIIAAIVIVSIMLLLTFGLILNRRKRKKYDKTDLYCLEYRETEQILNEFKIVRRKNETLNEFALKYRTDIQNVLEKCRIENKSFYSVDDGFIKIYEEVIYGNRIPQEAEIDGLREAKRKFMRLLKRYYKMTYIIHKLHLFILSSIKIA